MKDILQQVDRRDGMTVPEGYFEDFAAKMAASLPRREWEDPAPRVVPRSLWQKVRPYVYMAAMFLGVWCMMNMFDLMRSSAGLGVENSATFAKAIGNVQFIGDYISSQMAADDYSLMEDLYDDGFVPASLTEMDMNTDSELLTKDI